ncbi:hypothetical protein [Jejuia pallidilutea]
MENEWLEIEWFKPQSFNTVIIDEKGNNISKYMLQYFVDGVWKDIASGALLVLISRIISKQLLHQNVDCLYLMQSKNQ